MADVTPSLAGTAVDRYPTLTPFVDPLPFPSRYRVTEPARLTVRIQNDRLVLSRDGRTEHHRIAQIGTDSGLLPAPVSLPGQGLVLASAERADLLVDFSDLPPGAELTWWNTAPAPFDGTYVDPLGAGTPNVEGLLPYPEVLRIRVD